MILYNFDIVKVNNFESVENNYICTHIYTSIELESTTARWNLMSLYRTMFSQKEINKIKIYTKSVPEVTE